MTPENLRELLPLSSTDPILPVPAQGKLAPHLPEGIYPAKEAAHNWCYYFEKADLARQQKDWQAVARLGDTAFALDDYPNDPAERLPFIEGYAHVGNWQQAVEISRDSAEVTPVMKPVLCRLWGRIATETDPTQAQQETLKLMYAENSCPAP